MCLQLFAHMCIYVFMKIVLCARGFTDYVWWSFLQPVSWEPPSRISPWRCQGSGGTEAYESSFLFSGRTRLQCCEGDICRDLRWNRRHQHFQEENHVPGANHFDPKSKSDVLLSDSKIQATDVHKHTETHTHIYNHIYIYRYIREREREFNWCWE